MQNFKVLDYLWGREFLLDLLRHVVQRNELICILNHEYLLRAQIVMRLEPMVVCLRIRMECLSHYLLTRISFHGTCQGLLLRLAQLKALPKYGLLRHICRVQRVLNLWHCEQVVLATFKIPVNRLVVIWGFFSAFDRLHIGSEIKDIFG